MLHVPIEVLVHEHQDGDFDIHCGCRLQCGQTPTTVVSPITHFKQNRDCKFGGPAASASMRVAIAGDLGASGAARRSAWGAACFLGDNVFCALFALLLLLVQFIIIVVIFLAVSVCLLPFYAHGALFYSCDEANPHFVMKRHTCSGEPQCHT